MPVPTSLKKDYYAILGLTKAATEEDIKTAFRNLVRTTFYSVTVSLIVS